MLALSIARRQLRSLWSAGEIRVLLFALILAVTATTSVSFFTDRIKASMQTQGNVLLGADLVGALGHGHGSISSATARIEAVGFPTVGRVTYVLGETLGAWWDRSDG